MIPDSEQPEYVKRLGELNRDSQVLSASVIDHLNQVFYADDLSSPCVNPRDLSVRYVDQENFHKMVNGDPSVSAYFEPATLYVVSSDEINAYNTNIKNVEDPVELKDAANKRYVDEQIENAVTATIERTANKCYVLSSIGDAPTVSNIPGDVAIVSAKIADDSSNISRTSFYWSGTTWEAMDGNYDTDHVFFQNDISCVGPWTSIGNIGKGSTTAISAIPAKGKSVTEVFEKIFFKDQDNATVTQPSLTISITNNTSKEVGETVVPQFRASFSNGSYTYGSISSDGKTWVNGTGVKTNVLSASDTLKTWPSIASGTTYTTSSSVTFTDTAGASYKVSAYVSYSAGNTVATAAHKASTAKTPIAAGSKTASANLVAGYRKPFWGYVLATDTQPAVDLASWSSGFIRALSATGGSGTSAKGLPTSWTVPVGLTYVIFACHTSTGYSNVVVVDDKSKQQQTFTKAAGVVNVNGANGYAASLYTIFYKKFSSPTEAQMDLRMTWS